MSCGPETTDIPVPDGEEASEILARLCKALGHPARVHIVRFLLEKDVCIAGEIADEVPLAASTVSQHLKILKDAGIIRGEIDGPRRNYCVNNGQLELLKVLIAGL